MGKEKFTISLSKKQIILVLIALVISGGLIRFLAAYSEVHYFDIPYYFDWAESAFKDGIFNLYNSLAGQEHAVDYPPLFLFPLYITGGILKNAAVVEFDRYLMLALKMWQVIFDLATIVAIYLILRKRSELLAFVAAAMWALNPAIIFSSSYWGQTDSIMLFMLIITFGAFDSKRPVLGTVLYALSCLTKFQCAYFAPVILLVLFCSKYGYKKIFYSIASAFLAVVIVFLPFMINSGIMLPFKIYLGGFGKWAYATLYAFNFMGALGLNYVSDSVQIFPFVSAASFGSFMTIIAVCATIIIFAFTKRKCPYMLSYFIMNTIFIFASRMHDRYQIPVIIFILVAAFKHKSGKLFVAYILSTVMVFLNSFIAFEEIVYRGSNPAPWMQNIDKVIISYSTLNICVYFVTLYITLDFFFDITTKIKTAYKTLRKGKGEPLNNDAKNISAKL